VLTSIDGKVGHNYCQPESQYNNGQVAQEIEKGSYNVGKVKGNHTAKKPICFEIERINPIS
jgi:hypothetical protein